MRTDVKIGLICAFVIVMGAVIYFVAQPARPTTPKTTVSSATGGSGTPATAPATGPSASGGVSGVLILPPAQGGTSAGSAGATGSTAGTGSTASSGLGTPSMGGPLAPGTGMTGFGSTGTTGAAGSTGGLTGTGSTGFGTGSTGTGTTGGLSASGSGSRGTIDFSSPRGDSTSFPGPSAPEAIGPSGPRTGTATGTTTYTVQKGDMLVAIAKKYNTTVKAIEDANPGIDPNRLKVDKPINIPAAALAAGTPSLPGPATRPTGHPDTTVAAAAKPGASYKVKKGDTLVTISRVAYGTDKSWKRIFDANHSAISDPNVVPVGLVIKIPQ